MIYNNIRFQAAPFFYVLEFTERITLVRGDSATGKTYLYQLLEDLKLTKEYSAIQLFNYKTEDFHEKLKRCKNHQLLLEKLTLKKKKNLENIDETDHHLDSFHNQS